MITHWLYSLPLLLLVACLAWMHAYRRHNVNIVDSLWSLLFLLASLVYAATTSHFTFSSGLLLALVALWSLRLSLHLLLRNAGKDEDRRYAAMRARSPRFAVMSLFTVFSLQAVLAWLISLPLAAALYQPAALGWLQLLGLLLFLLGFLFEAVGDWQLTRFKRDPGNRGRVLDTGLWAYTRHPNYFGEACIWWAFFLFALASGSLVSIISPILVTLLLLKVSGVSMLEKDIAERRPAYRDYMQSTAAFLPWFPKSTDKLAKAPQPWENKP